MGYVLSRVSAVTMCYHIWSCATTYGLRVVTYGSCVITLGYVLSHMGFQSPLQRPKGLFRTPHGLLGYQRSSALFRPVCLSVCLQPVCLSPDSQSDCLRFFSPPHPPLVDSLDSELWYHVGCRAAALASAAPRPLGSLSAAFHHAERAPRVTSSLTAESPTIRSFLNHPGCRHKDFRHPCPTRKEDS